MKIVSIQVGQPKELIFNGKTITTSIFKEPVKGPLRIDQLNIEGDRQADLRVHGGIDKAIYAYSYEAYNWWKKTRPDTYSFGAFGENLTIDEFSEKEICIGDSFQVGEAILQVAQPRMPCYKLAVKFNDPSILKAFMKSGRPGIYFRVLKEGMVDAGDELIPLTREKARLSIYELFTLGADSTLSKERIREILSIESLIADYREQFEAMLLA